MASLLQLLSQEGFESRSNNQVKSVKSQDHGIKSNDQSIALPIYICYDKKSFDFSKQKPKKNVSGNGSTASSSKKRGSESDRSNLTSFESDKPWKDEPAIDEIAVRAVISILSGYIGRFITEESFRERIREKSCSCLVRRKYYSNNGIIANMELGMESIERLIENGENRSELKMKSLKNSIRFLSIVASLNSPNSKNNSTCGIPNSNLSACAQLYLSIVYKLEKNDRISARHLLQVFCDSTFLARTHLLPDLWERFFLPHLLHLKVWYTKEVELLSNSRSVEKERIMKALSKLYHDRMDLGTQQFALYYKEWLKTGVIKPPPIPSVSLPTIPSNKFHERRSLGSFASHSSINKSLYRTIFGDTYERQTRSLELEHSRDGILTDSRGLEEEFKISCDEDNFKLGSSVHIAKGIRRSSSQNYKNPKAELWPGTYKLDYLRFFSCQNEPPNGFIHKSHVGKSDAITRELNSHPLSRNVSSAITSICTSDSLSDCEIAIRVIAKVWLDSHGDPGIETSLSKQSVIEGMLEVLFASKDEEVLELAISILAELVGRNEITRQIILYSDPQLEIFLRLLRSSSLFLKSSVLIYLLKPKAKQMLLVEWIPLVLRVLEFGDQMQTLFGIRCSPQVAAFYLLGQLLTGFDVDRNIENARKVVSLGGLSLLVRTLEIGDHNERGNAALFMFSCIRADGSCRNYLANSITKSSILELLRNQTKSSSCALSLLTELLCLNKRTHITKFLNELKNDGGCLNTMHVLLVYLQRAPLEERPLVASILLQLDLLGDPLQYSMYREEVVDAIVEALDCKTCNEKVQEQSGRALLLLGGCFSYVGEASVETWLLKQAGFNESPGDSFHGKEVVLDMTTLLNEEEEATEDWLRKAATVLLMSGNKRLLIALSESVANGIPCLARASLVTVAWMSISLHSIQDTSLRSMACSILVPRLLETLSYDKQLEERVLATLSLLNLIKNSECFSRLPLLNKDSISYLRNLCLVTWTATELLSMVVKDSSHGCSQLEIVPI